MAQEASIDTPAGQDGEGVRRRDFINIAAVSAAGIGAVAVVYPLISQMAPSADVLAESSTEVDISAVQPGQAIKSIFRKQPVFIRNLTTVEIEEANKVDVSGLRDPQTLKERTKEGHENWLITMGVCTHLGCVPTFRPTPGSTDIGAQWPGGFYCPCHGSLFDLAGRVYKNKPAPDNLVVPPHKYLSDTRIVIGEDTKGA